MSHRGNPPANSAPTDCVHVSSIYTCMFRKRTTSHAISMLLIIFPYLQQYDATFQEMLTSNIVLRVNNEKRKLPYLGQQLGRGNIGNQDVE